MFIAHLPAGYLATRFILRRHPAPGPLRRRLMALGMAASVLPDLDLLWFYFVDERRQVHHAYLPHLPLFCLAVFGVAALVLRLRGAGRTAWLAMMVLAVNVMLHQVLDTVAGGIRWLWPFSRAELVLAHVPARHDAWVLNFVLHWSFGLELVILAAALAAERSARRHPPGAARAPR